MSIFFAQPSVTAPPNKKRAWSWPAYLEEERAIAVPVKLFKEVYIYIFFFLLRPDGFVYLVSVKPNHDCTMMYICLAASVVSSKQEQF